MLHSMPTPAPRINRGPAAAAENRRALLANARRLFAERGYDVPLHAIAQAAGVGQGVLYRHFPRRVDLALAVFDENMSQMEAECATVGPGSFERLWWRLVEQISESAAFVEMAVHARREVADATPIDRLRRLLEEHLGYATAAGEVRADLTVDDVQAAIRMVYGLVLTSESGETLRPTATRLAQAWFDPRE